MPRVEAEQLSLFDLGPDMAKIRRAAASLKRQTRAAATLVSYDCDWRSFECWCVSVGRRAMPADGETVTLYVASRLEEGLRASTVQRAVAAVAYRHKVAGEAVPDRMEARAVLNGARRQRLEQPVQRAALAVEDLRKICRRLMRHRTAAAARDRALLVLGFATGLRRSNLVALDLADLRFVPRRGVAVMVRRSKTDQEGRGQVIGVFRGKREETCPVRALRSWLAFRGEADGPLFTRVRVGGPTLSRLNPDTVNQLVKASVASVGLDPVAYGAHSLRAGFVTEAHNEGSGTLAIMERTGHRSVEMVRRYLRNSDPFACSNPLARAL